MVGVLRRPRDRFELDTLEAIVVMVDGRGYANPASSMAARNHGARGRQCGGDDHVLMAKYAARKEVKRELQARATALPNSSENLYHLRQFRVHPGDTGESSHPQPDEKRSSIGITRPITSEPLHIGRRPYR